MNHRNIHDYISYYVIDYIDKSDKLKQWLMKMAGAKKDTDIKECSNIDVCNNFVIDNHRHCTECKSLYCDDCYYKHAFKNGFHCNACETGICDKCIETKKDKAVCFYCNKGSCFNCYGDCDFCDINICGDCEFTYIIKRKYDQFSACSFCYLKYINFANMGHKCKKGSTMLSDVVMVPSTIDKGIVEIVCVTCHTVECTINIGLPTGKTLKNVPKSSLDIE